MHMQRFTGRLDIHPDVVKRLEGYVKRNDKFEKYYLESCIAFSKKLNKTETNRKFFFLVAKALVLHGEIILMKRLFEGKNEYFSIFGEKKEELISMARQANKKELISFLKNNL